MGRNVVTGVTGIMATVGCAKVVGVLANDVPQAPVAQGFAGAQVLQGFGQAGAATAIGA
jgi:hypothetical protein